MSRDPSTDEDFRTKVCAWFRANGLDPARLPMESNASIADGRITTLRKVGRPGEHGRLVDVLNPNGDGVLVETVTVPLLVEPDAEIAEWLRPRCPTCGR